MRWPRPSLGPLSPVVWRGLHEPWSKVRLATLVEPLNLVFVSRIDGFDLGRSGRRRAGEKRPGKPYG